MNQTQKRLQIIKIAISINDIETIQLQILKLGPLKTDEHVQQIVAMLHANNYAQAQERITAYIEEKHEEIDIVQRTSQVESDEPIMDYSHMAHEELNENEPKTEAHEVPQIVLEEDEIVQEEAPKTLDPYEELLNIESDNVLSHTSPTAQERIEETFESYSDATQGGVTKITEEDLEEDPQEEEHIETSQAEPQTLSEEEILSDSPRYKAIPYIKEKFAHMQKQYPSAYANSDFLPHVEALMEKIAHEGYSEAEITKALMELNALSNSMQYMQATQLIHLCGATESKFARLILARELYKGILLTEDIQQSFFLLNKLAMYDYPEALCDLGQFYENGIGTKKDKKQALELYTRAMNAGIKRAEAHVARLNRKGRFF